MSSVSSSTESPKQPVVPWNPVGGVVYAVIIFFVVQIIAGLLVSIYPLLHGWDSQRTMDWLNNAVSSQFCYVLLAETLTIAAIVWFVRLYKAPLSIIGLKRPRLRDPLVALPAYIVYFLVFALAVVLISQFVPGINVNQQQQIGFNNVHGGLALTLTFVSLVILPPLAEEIVMRGFIFTSLRKHFRFAGATLITSLIFAVAHLPEGGAAGPLYIAAVDTFLLSLVLCFLREKTGSLWASITLHALKNGIAYVSLFILAVR